MQTATVKGTYASSAIAAVVTQVGGYSPPASTAAIISALTVANTSAATRTVKVSIYNGTTDFYVAFNAPIAVGDSLMIGGADAKYVLQTGWQIRVVADAASVDATMAVTEVS